MKKLKLHIIKYWLTDKLKRYTVTDWNCTFQGDHPCRIPRKRIRDTLQENSVFHEKLDKAYIYNNEIDIYIGLDIDEIFLRLNDLKLFVKTIYKHCREDCRFHDELELLSGRMAKLDKLALHLKLITHSRYADSWTL